MNHNLVKLGLYFNNKPYWRLSESNNLTIKTKLGPFFLNLEDRLKDNHYSFFDEEGFPMDLKNGQLEYTYTTICSYALAKWQVYLQTGDKKYSEQLFKTINYLFKNYKKTKYDGIIFPFGEVLSAMNQGEALSLLARGYAHTNEEKYIYFAKRLILPYDVLIADYGVKGKFKDFKDLYWYEEYAEIPSKHILNGMVYSLVGLWEIHQVMPQLTMAKDLFDKGIKYVEKALHLFDTGKWSWYWIDEENPNYIASAMYHNLHICQLNYLFSITGSSILKEYANKFEVYSNNPLNKLLSGFSLLKAKINKR